MGSNSYKDLIVWQKSMDLVVQVYNLTEEFPKSEMFGLTSQMQRCAVSIPSNITEGSNRGTQKDFRQFILISFGSGAELETQIEIAHRLKLFKTSEYIRVGGLLDEVMRMLNAFALKLKTTN